MVAPAAGSVVLVRFPFTDLTGQKLRPAIALAYAGRDDWVLCQVTSASYGDPRAVEINEGAFASGSLSRLSFARPGKLFTANTGILVREAGMLTAGALSAVVRAVIALLMDSLPDADRRSDG